MSLPASYPLTIPLPTSMTPTTMFQFVKGNVYCFRGVPPFCVFVHLHIRTFCVRTSICLAVCPSVRLSVWLLSDVVCRHPASACWHRWEDNKQIKATTMLIALPNVQIIGRESWITFTFYGDHFQNPLLSAHDWN